MLFLYALLLSSLFCSIDWQPALAEPVAMDQFVASGKKNGEEAAYEYLFDESFEHEESDDLRNKQTVADQTFSVPQEFTLLTVRDDDQVQALHYGDLIRLWHKDSGYYLHTHNIKYDHPDSSGQTQTTLLINNDRKQADRKAVWWRVAGPHGSDETTLFGKPVDLTKAIRLFALPGQKDNFSVKPDILTLHSHSYKIYDHSSPVREKSAEARELKQEVSCYNKRDENDNWMIMKPQAKEAAINCALRGEYSFLHQKSHKFLRSKKGIIFNVQADVDNNSPVDMQQEVCALAPQDHPLTTFKIALIARKEVIINKLFAQDYLSHFDPKQPHTITAEEYYDQSGALITDTPKRVNKSASDLCIQEEQPAQNATITLQPDQQRSTFYILIDKKHGCLGLQASDQTNNLIAQQNFTNPTMLNRIFKKQQKIWQPDVSFESNDFNDQKYWIPIDAGDGNIYLQHQQSGWFMAAQEGKIIADQNKKTKFSIRPQIVE